MAAFVGLDDCFTSLRMRTRGCVVTVVFRLPADRAPVLKIRIGRHKPGGKDKNCVVVVLKRLGSTALAVTRT